MADEKLPFQVEVSAETGIATFKRLRAEVGAAGQAAEKAGKGFSSLGARIVTLNQGLDLAQKVLRTGAAAFNALVRPTVRVGAELLTVSCRSGATAIVNEVKSRVPENGRLSAEAP